MVVEVEDFDVLAVFVVVVEAEEADDDLAALVACDVVKADEIGDELAVLAGSGVEEGFAMLATIVVVGSFTGEVVVDVVVVVVGVSPPPPRRPPSNFSFTLLTAMLVRDETRSTARTVSLLIGDMVGDPRMTRENC